MLQGELITVLTKVRNKERGQSLVELLVGVAIVTIIISSVVVAVVLVLRIHFQSVAARGAAALEQEMMDSVRSIAEGNWVNLYEVDPKGPDTTYRVSLSSTDEEVAGTGLAATYYDNQNFTGTTVSRTDQTVNFSWGGGSPDPSISNNTFSVRWTGQVKPRYSENYTFYTVSDDGVRLWVNNQLIVDNWTDHPPTENSGQITLTANEQYDIKLEYYENTGSATIQLFWSSPSQAKEIIPQIRLYSGSEGGGASAPVLTIESGSESTTVNNITYTRFFSVENVNRDANGSIVIGGGTEDPSTQKVTVTVRWQINGGTRELKITEYLTRSRSEVLWFTDWSGEGGVEGGAPPEQVACFSTPPAGRTIVKFSGQPVLPGGSRGFRSEGLLIVSHSSAAEARLGPVAASLPAGEYYVTLVSYDSHSGVGYTDIQYKERWYVLLEASDGTDIATTRVVSDLPDRLDDLQEVTESNLVLDNSAAQATAIHPDYFDASSPNSIRPICAAFDRISNPSQRRSPSLVWRNYSFIAGLQATSTIGELSLVTGVTSGHVKSSIFDTGIPGGAAFNSIMWQGVPGSGGTTAVKFQLATANCLDGETNPPQCTSGTGWDGSKTSGDGAFVGPDGTSATFYQPSGPGSPMPIVSAYHNNKRFFRYKVVLERNPVGATSPTVRDIIINWSP